MKRALKFLLYILGGYSIAGAALWMSVDRVGGREFRAVAAQLPSLKQQAKDLGMDFDIQTVLNKRAVPDSENAAEEFARAYEVSSRVHDERYGDEGFGAWTKRLDSGKEGEREAVLRQLKEREIVVKAYEKAVSKPRLVFKSLWNDGFYPELRHGADIETPLLLIAARITVEARIGQIDQALEELELSYKMCRLTQEYSFLKGLNRQNAFFNVVDNAAIQLIPYAERAPNGLTRLWAIVDKSRKPHDPDWVIRTECAMLFESVAKISREEGNWNSLISQYTGRYRDLSAIFTDRIPAILDKNTVTHAFQSRILQCMLPALQDYERTRDPFSFTKILDAEFARRAALAETDSSNLALAIVGDTFSGGFDYMFAIDTRRLLILGMIQVVQYKNREGWVPKSLSSANVNYKDPFTAGAPLRYLHFGSELVLYSVGYNRVDDGGVGRARDIRVMYSPVKHRIDPLDESYP